MLINACPVCNSSAETGYDRGDTLRVHCLRCGSFSISGTALAMLPSRLAANTYAAARMSHAIRSGTSETNSLEIDSTRVDELLSRPLPSPDRQLVNLIEWLKAQVGDAHFSGVKIGSKRDAIATVIGAVDTTGLQTIIRWGVNEGVIEISDAGSTLILTPKAWEHPKERRVRPVVAPSVEQSKVISAHCPECGPKRNADVVASHAEHWDDEENPVWTIDTYSVLRCRGCRTVYVQREFIFSEDVEWELDTTSGEMEQIPNAKVTYWPAPACRKRPEWLEKLKDETLHNLLDEMYGALDLDHRVLAAIGARTALDRAMELAGATAALGFAEKLNELQSDGMIGENEKRMLLVLTDAGSAAAHRGWRPTPMILETIMDGTESFLHRAFVLGDQVRAMRKNVPRKPRRPKKKKDRL